VVVREAELHSIDEAWQVILLVGLHYHLQEADQVLVEVSLKDAQTRLHDLDGELDHLIQVHEFLDDVRNEDPDLFEEFGIWVL
jgi:hypothetical protein